MSDVAGSGGYWIAMGADKIVAQPGTITGSIGVVSGKFITRKLWDDLGIMTVSATSGRVKTINFMLFGDLENQDISPKSRFSGSIQLPSGVLVFDDYVELENQELHVI